MVPRAVSWFSFWTGGTRKGCTGQYVWCNSINRSMQHTSQLLATSNSGACVILTRMRNVAGIVEYAYLNEDCTEKAQLACVTNDTFAMPTIDEEVF